MQNRIMSGVALLAATVALAACGGGGSGTGQPGGSPVSQNPSPLELASGENSQQVATVSKRVSGSEPRFGSVYQTAHSGVAAVTDVDVRQNEDRYTLVVRRRDGTATSITTADDTWESQAANSFTDRTARQATLLKADGDLMAVAGYLDYDPDNYGDWMAVGYWLSMRGDWTNGRGGVEVGAFAEGPEFERTVTLPSSGTATYRGIAGGLYSGEFGTDTQSPGVRRIGDYRGDFTATADFGRRTVRGEIRNLEAAGYDVRPNDPRLYPFYEPPSSSTYLVLEEAGMDDPSALAGHVRVVSSDFDFTTENGGRWGGQMSSVNDHDGAPRAVTGTHAGSATTPGGTEVSYIGAHGGATGGF